MTDLLDLELSFINTAQALSNLRFDAQRTAIHLRRFSAFLEENREWFLVSGSGQWPDKFALLNRYIRTGQESPYLLDDRPAPSPHLILIR